MGASVMNVFRVKDDGRFDACTMTFVMVAALVGSGACMSVMTAAPRAQAAQGRMRELSWNLHARIQDLLLPDDEIVVLTMSFLEVALPTDPLTIKQVIDEASLSADVVAILDVNSVEAVLSQNDSWVDTRLMRIVREVWRVSPSQAIRRGQRLEARLSGGELAIRKVLVGAGDRAPVIIPHLYEKRSYVVFMKWHSPLQAFSAASRRQRQSQVPRATARAEHSSESP